MYWRDNEICNVLSVSKEILESEKKVKNTEKKEKKKKRGIGFLLWVSFLGPMINRDFSGQLTTWKYTKKN